MTKNLDTLERKIRYNGPLYSTLCDFFLARYTSRQGILDIQRIAADAGISAVTVYHAIRSCRMTPSTARKLIELHSRAKRDAEDKAFDAVSLAPFVI
jgi:hypothetical protein